jgi:hypothetical protein
VNELEYHWGVDLDTDEDGISDLAIWASHFKFDNQEVEVDVDALVDYLQKDIWRLSSHGGDIVTDDVTVSLTDHTFQFVTRKRANAVVSRITQRSQVKWTSSYNLGADSCHDVLE